MTKEVSVTDDPDISENITTILPHLVTATTFTKTMTRRPEIFVPRSDKAHSIRLPDEGRCGWSCERVATGFQTQFSFRISDQTRSCTLVKDTSFASSASESCRVRADGFAFVLPRHENGTAAGKGGSGMDLGRAKRNRHQIRHVVQRRDEDLAQFPVVIVTNGMNPYSPGKKSCRTPSCCSRRDGKEHTADCVLYPAKRQNTWTISSLHRTERSS